MKTDRIILLMLVYLSLFLLLKSEAQELSQRKEKLTNYVKYLKSIPVTSELEEVKEKEINDLIQKINNISSEEELKLSYEEFLRVRKWLLDSYPKRPSLSEEEFTEDSNSWIIKNSQLTLKLDKKNLILHIEKNDILWEFAPSDESDIVMLDKRFSLFSAKQITCESLTTGYSKGFTLRFTEFPDNPDFILYITFQLSGNTVDIDISASDTLKKLVEVNFPKNVILNTSIRDLSILPVMQGMLLYADYNKKFYGKDLCNSRMAYMPWWGHIRSREGILSIISTPDDAGINIAHDEGGPTKVSVVWFSRLGELGYTRRIKLMFISEATYVKLAKLYKKWKTENEGFVSLKEKISRCPNLERIIGVPIIHVGALYHFENSSHYYNKNIPEINHQIIPLEEIENNLKKLKEKGVASAYVHLDGWGYYGYDSGHPDIIPPSPEIGGAEKLKTLSKTCEELDYTLALHDNYRDFYLNAISFHPKLAITNRNGIKEKHSIWCGGHQMILSPRFILPYVQRNYEWLFDNNINIKGVYLDVFSIVPLEENYEKFCPISRSECAKYRASSFYYLKSKGLIVSSEEPTDYLVSIIDLVHHGPYWISPSLEKGEKVGIPIPLFNLVYHDSLIIPWSTSENGGWGIPTGDPGYLHCILNAGMPYLSVNADEQEIQRILEICKIFKHCQLLEMTNHEFLDENFRVQKTTFSDGTTIIVDFDQRTYKVHYPTMQ
ncbi:MAG: DUF5696 domain-containing protein [Candidatus Hydrogenedentes bacterium]|nr:DUF5696 domain-containing protein [Candidatus Hydrogenedentota bacterium]